MNNLEIKIKTSSTEQQIIENFQQLKNNKKLTLNIDVLPDFGNQFMICVANQFQNYSQLEDLKIIISQQCFLGQQEYLTLGNGLCKLQGLQILRIYIEEYCIVNADFIPGLSQGIKQLTQLVELDIQIKEKNDIGEVGCKSLSESIQQLTNLQKLSVQIEKNCQICRNSIGYILQSIKQSVNIYELVFKVDFTRLNETEIIQLSNSLTTLKNLRNLTLIIEKNEYIFTNILIIFKAISELQQLIKLKVEISENQQLFIEDLYQISLILSQLNNLEELSLVHIFDNLQQECLIQLFKSLSQMNKLKCLTLTLDRILEINQESSQQIGNFLKCLKQLKDLKLRVSRYFNYKDEFIYEIIDSLQEMKQLNQLDIDFQSQINARECLIFFQILQHLKELNKFKIEITDNYCITNESIEQFAQSLKQLNNLNDLSFDSYSKTNYSPFLLSLENLKQLKQLSLQLQNVCCKDALLNLGKSLSNVSSLQYLNIQLTLSQEFDKLSFETIFSSLKNQIQLEDLNLQLFSEQILNQDEIQCFFEGLKTCKKIKKLNFYVNCDFNSKMSQEFKDSLLNLEELETIYITFVQKNTIQDLNIILSGLQSKNLKTLNLVLSSIVYDQKIGNEQNYEDFYNILSHLTNLEELYIFGDLINNVKVNFQKIILKSIQNISKLIYLNLNFSHSTLIDNETLQAFGGCFYKNPNLQQLQFNLKIRNKMIDINSVNNFYNGLQSLKSLKTLIIDMSTENKYIQLLLNQIYKLQNISNVNISLNDGYGISKGKTEQKKNDDDQICIQNTLDQSQFTKISKLYQMNLLFMFNHSQILELDFFQNMKAFKYLRFLLFQLSNQCQISDQDLLEFSSSLSYLSNLQELYLYFQININFSFEVLDNIALSITKLVKLETFTAYFMSEFVKSNGMCNIMKSFSQLKNLQYLNLNFSNQIEPQLIKNLGESIYQIKGLRQFIIDIRSVNESLEEGFISLRKGLQSASELTYLSILLGENVIIGEQGVISLGQGLSNLKKLIYFEISINNCLNITDSGYSELFKSLSNHKHLQGLLITLQNSSNISSESIQQISLMLTVLKQLQNIIIEIEINEYITSSPLQLFEFYEDKCIEKCEISFYNYQNLTCQLGVSQNNLQLNLTLKFNNKNQQSFTIEPLLKTLGYLPVFTQIIFKFFENCKLDQNNYEILSQQLKSLKTQNIEITISHNNLLSQSSLHIANGLSQMKNLQQLSIRIDTENKISSQASLEFVKNICKCNLISKLKIHIDYQEDFELTNYIHILKQLSAMKRLRILDVSSEHFFHVKTNRKKAFQQICKNNIRLVGLRTTQYYETGWMDKGTEEEGNEQQHFEDVD